MGEECAWSKLAPKWLPTSLKCDIKQGSHKRIKDANNVKAHANASIKMKANVKARSNMKSNVNATSQHERNSKRNSQNERRSKRTHQN